MLLSSILGGIGSLASSIIGGIQSAKAQKKASELIQNQRDENRQWYNTKMNQDYTQRADVQNAITRQRELLDEQIKRANANKVVGGGSDESAALAKEAANKSVADATADIAADSANYKDQVENQYRAQEQNLNQEEIKQYQDKASQNAQAGATGVQAGLGMIGTGTTTLGDVGKAVGNIFKKVR